MQDEQVTCRICSAPAEPDQPLFHPCKCSGTIRYIHQDCLTTWLAHSKKKTCDICKYPYSFTKVYSENMPERLPLVLLLRQLSRQAASAAIFCIRALMVGTVWLAILPWATIWTWRMYFAMGDSTAWWISNRPRPTVDADAYNMPSSNRSSSFNGTSSSNATIPTSIFSHPIVRAVSSDIVSGQIIASLIVLAFVAIFLLREWISQNARPGIFDEADVLGEEQGPPQAPPVPPPVIREQAVLALQPAPAANEREIFGAHHVRALDTRALDRPQKDSPNKRIRHTTDADEPGIRERRLARRGKGKRRERSENGSRQLHRWYSPGMSTSSVFGGSESADEQDLHDRRERRKQWEEHTARWRDLVQYNTQPLNLDPEQTRFTFRAVTPHQADPDQADDAQPDRDTIGSDSGPHQISVAITLSPPRSTSPDVPDDVSSLSSPIESNLHNLVPPSTIVSVSSEARNAELPEDPTTSSKEPPSATVVALISVTDVGSDENMENIPSTSSSGPAETLGGLRRPPLPSVTLPPSSGSSPSASRSRSRGPTPLASPNLVTYRPPEEFEVGPSTLSGYFDGEGLTPDDDAGGMDAEHRRYFADVDEDVEDDAELGEEDMHEDAELYHWSDEDLQDADDDDFPRDALAVQFQQPNDAHGHDRPAERVPVQDVQNADGQGRPPEQNEDLDINLEDDMDGALEAIGLRGPLHSVLQNAALMIFILDTTIGLGVWLPFTVGKSTALLSLDPRRFLQLVHLPLRAIRLVTDPIVDTVLMLITRLTLPLMLRFVRVVSSFSFKALERAIGHDHASRLVDMSTRTYRYSSNALDHIWDHTAPWFSSKPNASQPQSPPLFIDRIFQHGSAFVQLLKPSFAPLGKKARIAFEEAKLTWLRLAIGSGPNEKIFAIVLGYAVVALLLALYLNILTVGNVKNAGRAVRSAVRQQLLVIKVAAFIVIELVIFPLGCGIMLDACTVWLLPHGNFRSGAAFLIYAPVTSIFYHWVIGTMFMYQFAVLLAGCRGIMRPGSMWFIKDPQDQNFHPIRDILERPTLVQVRKLLLSAVMYGLVVAAGVGTVSGVLQLFSQTILPFRWKIREPLSTVPIDLLFLHLVLPYTMQYFRPKKAMRQFGIHLWKYLAGQLRLSSYMFGGRHPVEENTARHWTWRMLFVKSEVNMDDAEAIHDGTFRRVPNSDNVALVKEMPATAEVDEDGVPVDEEQVMLIAAQNAEADKAKRNIKDDYTVVYVPPNLKYRVTAFILSVWLVGSVILGLTLGAPILLGRGFFRLFVSHDVHDGYSFIAGFYLLWACWLVGYTIDRMDKRRQRRGGNEPRAELPLYVAKRSLLWIAQMSYMALFFGFVIPTLIALVIEFYIVQPIRQITDPPVALHVRIIDMWAYGLVYSKILIRCLRMQPGNEFVNGIDHIKRQGWTHPDPFRATREVIAPVTFGLLGMLFLPAGILWSLRRFLLLPITDDFLFVHVYPSIFTVAGFGHATLVLSKVIATWSQTIRDKEFLVEMRLQNHEPEPEQEKERDKENENEKGKETGREIEAEAREDEEEEEE